MFSHYFENMGWNIYATDGTPIGCLPESAAEDPAAFDPEVFPLEDSEDFRDGELFGADHSHAH